LVAETGIRTQDLWSYEAIAPRAAASPQKSTLNNLSGESGSPLLARINQPLPSLADSFILTHSLVIVKKSAKLFSKILKLTS
jgi:hypothetical protein